MCWFADWVTLLSARCKCKMTNLMPLAVLFQFLCTQHVSDINILRLCCWITTSVVLFLVRCVLEIWCGWVWVVSVLQAEASACNMDTTQNEPHQISNIQRNENKTTDLVIQQHSRKLLTMDILISKTRWVHKKWNKIASDIKLVFYSSTITMMHGPINIRFNENDCYLSQILAWDLIRQIIYYIISFNQSEKGIFSNSGAIPSPRCME